MHFSEHGGTLCEGSRRGLGSAADPVGRLSGPRRQRRNDVLRRDVAGEGFCPTLTSPGNWGGRAWGVRVSRAPRQRADFLRDRSHLVEASAILVTLSKTFFPRLFHNFVLCSPVRCHHSLVNEKLGNFPEGDGENGWPRRKEQANPAGTGNLGVR